MSKTTVIRTVIWPLLGVLIGSVVGVLLTGGDLDGEKDMQGNHGSPEGAAQETA